MKNCARHERGQGSRIARGLGIAALIIASIGARCSESGTRECLAYACFNSAELTGKIAIDPQTSAVDAHFCFDAQCLDGVIELMPADGSTPCAQWQGGTSVCLLSTDASGVYEIRATWDHQLAKKPADGSTYTLVVRDPANDAVLLDQTSAATYTDGPNLDGCHPECWRAEPIAIADQAAGIPADSGAASAQ